LPDKSGVKASALSDGTLYTLGLITFILSPQRPKTLLIDDIDYGLHPKAQKELVEVLRKLLAQYPDLQIIATTHSLYILHWLEFNEVRLLTLNDEGATVCGRLDEHPDYERWKEAMTPGEFWTHVGEDWLLKKQPEPVGAAS
jgi:predicted ATPase